MKYVVKCATCNVSLTRPLEKLKHVSMLDSQREKERAPIGSFGVNSGDLVANTGDITNTKHHWDSERLIGCCGLAGLDGLNVLCLNGHEVATEQSDCTGSHCLTFEGGAVWLERIWIDEAEFNGT